MKKFLCIFVFLSMLLLVLSHEAYAKGHGSYRPHKTKSDEKKIQADKARVCEDRKETQADKQVFKEARKSKDKTRIEEARKKLKQDIEKEKADKVILKKDMK